MGQIQFVDDSFQIICAGEMIALLPKEYALFQFLYTHKNQLFSRDELLDHVWTMEEPTDRTVDDHVYRLRKKLLPLSHLLSIDTVRGKGYKLTRKESLTNNPLLQNPDFTENVRNLFKMYHGFGMGAAMQTLSANQEVLGIEIDPFYNVYMHFVRGDFAWIVETDSISFGEKWPYLLFMYSSFQFDSKKTLDFFERSLVKKQLLPLNWRTELDINIIALYIKTGQLSRANEQLLLVQPVVEKMNSSSFTLILHFKRIYLSLVSGHQSETDKLIQEAEEILLRSPLQRELGVLTTVKGVWHFQQGDKRKARKLIDEGIETLQKTKFVPHLLHAIHLVLFFLETYGYDEEWKRIYQKLWQQLSEQYQFAQLEEKIYKTLTKHL